jgi:hypothetical protein
MAMAAPLPALETPRQSAHLLTMDKRATHRPAGFEKPAHWTNEPPPAPKPPETAPETDEKLSATRYGDWVKDGIAIDF